MFRQDLLYRLNTVEVRLPPLRDRGGDIPLLAEHFLREFVKSCGRPVLSFSPEVLDLFQKHAWRGWMQTRCHARIPTGKR